MIGHFVCVHFYSPSSQLGLQDLIVVPPLLSSPLLLLAPILSSPRLPPASPALRASQPLSMVCLAPLMHKKW